MSYFQKISLQEKVDFVKSLAVMLRSSIPLNEALIALACQVKSKRFREVLMRVKEKVEEGVSLGEALAREGGAFDAITMNLLKAGEKSGKLEENLAFLAVWLEHKNEMGKEISAAMLYPKIVFSATALLGGWIGVLILPKLVPFFRELRVALPFSTRLLLVLSLFISKFWLLVIVGIALLIVGFHLLNKIRTVKRFLHARYLGLPFFGDLILNYQLTIFSQLFSTLLRSGLSIGEVLDITSQSATNIRYEEALQNIKERVVRGVSLSSAMKEYLKLFPQNVVSMVAVGEKSGALDKSFQYVADFYSGEVRNKTRRLPTIIEPMLLMVIGLIVGFIALSIISPIYELVRGLQQV